MRPKPKTYRCPGCATKLIVGHSPGTRVQCACCKHIHAAVEGS